MLYLSKFLVLPFYPVGFALMCIAAALVVMVRNTYRLARLFILFAGLVLYLFSSDPLSYVLVRSLERRYDPMSSFPSASAIVLLTGGRWPRRRRGSSTK